MSNYENCFSLIPQCVFLQCILQNVISSEKGRGFKLMRLVSVEWCKLVGDAYPHGDVEFADNAKTLISKYGLNNSINFSLCTVKNGVIYHPKNITAESISDYIAEYKLVVDSTPRNSEFYARVINKMIRHGIEGNNTLLIVSNLIKHGIWIQGDKYIESLKELCEKAKNHIPTVQPIFIRAADRIIRAYDHKTSIEELFFKKGISVQTINSHPQLTVDFIYSHLDYDWNPMMFSYESGLIKFSDVYNSNRELILPIKNMKYTYNQVLSVYCSRGVCIPRDTHTSNKNITKLFFNLRIPWNDLVSVCCKKMWILNRIVLANIDNLTRTDIPLNFMKKLQGGLTNEQILYYAYAEGKYSWKDITRKVWKRHQSTILANIRFISTFEIPTN